jgi:predicted nucleic acid-binding protein
LGRDLLAHNIAEVIEVTSTDLEKAFIAFSTYQDKSWSFTDCTSLVVMKRLGIGQAIALDYHFGQMPGVTLYP